MAKFDTVRGLFWWEDPKISHGYRLDLKNKYGRDTIPHPVADHPPISNRLVQFTTNALGSKSGERNGILHAYLPNL